MTQPLPKGRNEGPDLNDEEEILLTLAWQKIASEEVEKAKAKAKKR